MIALIDHGVGNLRSVEKALAAVGADVQLTASPKTILAAEKVVLPGVGAFADAMNGLHTCGLTETVKTIAALGTPLLGICVGMQMLFDFSEEHGEHAGLGLLPGRVLKFETADLKIPQTGWNQIHPARENPLLQGLPAGSYAYFNHSYYCAPQNNADVLATTDYSLRYASVVQRGRLYGVQFHPEKSQQVGLTILRNFVEQC
ncbi:MAG: imidazole glycerol phosphate synthase subunit HisH [Chloroflexota bacterium]|nr:imidazole glycerol phosphate synthase subunit HisH [Chloroflexota bacterium]